jgi:hypothetical protein
LAPELEMAKKVSSPFSSSLNSSFHHQPSYAASWETYCCPRQQSISFLKVLGGSKSRGNQTQTLRSQQRATN